MPFLGIGVMGYLEYENRERMMAMIHDNPDVTDECLRHFLAATHETKEKQLLWLERPTR